MIVRFAWVNQWVSNGWIDDGFAGTRPLARTLSVSRRCFVPCGRHAVDPFGGGLNTWDPSPSETAGDLWIDTDPGKPAVSQDLHGGSSGTRGIGTFSVVNRSVPCSARGVMTQVAESSHPNTCALWYVPSCTVTNAPPGIP